MGDQIDMCNQRRAQISQGLVMQRSVGGYAQQDSMQDGPGSTRGSSHATPDSTRSSRMATKQFENDRMILPHNPTLLSTSTAPLVPKRIRLLKMRPLRSQSMETRKYFLCGPRWGTTLTLCLRSLHIWNKLALGRSIS